MKVLTKILKFLTWLPVLFRNISVVCLVVIITLLFLESVVRTSAGVSIIVVTELGGIGLLGFVLFSLAWIYQQRGHLRMGIIVDRFPYKPRLIFEFFVSILSIGFIGFALYTWVDMTMTTFETKRYFYLTRIPEWPVQMAAVVAWGVFGIAIVERAVSQAKQLFGKQ